MEAEGNAAAAGIGQTPLDILRLWGWKHTSAVLGLTALLVAAFSSLENSNVHLGLVNVDSSTKTTTDTGTEDEYNGVQAMISLLMLGAIGYIIHILSQDDSSRIDRVNVPMPSLGAGFVGGPTPGVVSGDQATQGLTTTSEEQDSPGPQVHIGPKIYFRKRGDTEMPDGERAAASETQGGSHGDLTEAKALQQPATRSQSNGATDKETSASLHVAAAAYLAELKFNVPADIHMPPEHLATYTEKTYKTAQQSL